MQPVLCLPPWLALEMLQIIYLLTHSFCCTEMLLFRLLPFSASCLTMRSSSTPTGESHAQVSLCCICFDISMAPAGHTLRVCWMRRSSKTRSSTLVLMRLVVWSRKATACSWCPFLWGQLLWSTVPPGSASLQLVTCDYSGCCMAAWWTRQGETQVAVARFRRARISLCASWQDRARRKLLSSWICSLSHLLILSQVDLIFLF